MVSLKIVFAIFVKLQVQSTVVLKVSRFSGHSFQSHSFESLFDFVVGLSLLLLPGCVHSIIYHLSVHTILMYDILSVHPFSYLFISSINFALSFLILIKILSVISDVTFSYMVMMSTMLVNMFFLILRFLIHIPGCCFFLLKSCFSNLL